ncbi:MAG: hypothetical protein ACFFEK_10880 [Candidatus Thorarchaeota archaeon]
MQIMATDELVGIILLLVTLSLLGVSILMERSLIWYFKRCVKRGSTEYGGEQIRLLSEDLMEMWQRAYMLSIKKPIALGIFTQLPYYIATVVILIVVFIPMSAASGIPWVLFPVWIIVLTIVSLDRAFNIAEEFKQIRKG